MAGADHYRAAGVDLDQAERAKQRIAQAVASTRTPLARGLIGAFGGMVRVPDGVSQPTLVLSTDGVGTKVLVAARARRHDTVGEDLVNHCVNDILVHGATPIAFLDYVAAAVLETEVIAAVVEGVARGCRAHAITLAGGETAQLPDLYQPGHYDLAGTIVGVVSEAQALHGDKVRAGDVLIGYAANGLHTNGYTLARRIVFDTMGLDVDDPLPGVDATVADALLAVHRSYYRAVMPVFEKLHALAHITGGGIPGNLTRSLPEGIGAVIEWGSWPVPPLCTVLQRAGHVPDDEMLQVFNMGVGLIAIAPAGEVDAVRAAARDVDVETWVIGQVAAGFGVRFR